MNSDISNNVSNSGMVKLSWASVKQHTIMLVYQKYKHSLQGTVVKKSEGVL